MGGSAPGQIDLNTVIAAGHTLSITREEKPEALTARLAEAKADNAQRRWKETITFLAAFVVVGSMFAGALWVLMTNADPFLRTWADRTVTLIGGGFVAFLAGKHVR